MKKSLRNWQGTAAVIGVDWGDSGKGRLIDDLAHRAHIIARFAGGANTGHTVKNSHGEFAFHIMPSGIFNPKAKCLIGRNVAVDLEVLQKEMESLDVVGVSYKNLVIDKQAHVTMPWHIERDGLREESRKSKVGTTKKGVGPTYADQTERVGIQIKDLIANDFAQKLKAELNFQNKHFNLKLKFEEIYAQYKKYAKRITPYIGRTVTIIREAKAAGNNILFEGAQGYFLDIDSGTYPFVTSSHPGIVGIWTGYDLHPSEVDLAIGITKSYTTRVGAGPMPTKIESEEADIIVKNGKEIGTTTGRRRDPGWLDLVLIKEAVDVNKLSCLAVTKLDILSGFQTIKVCVEYQINGESVGYFGHDADYLTLCHPVYEELPGWQEDISNVRKFENLPKNAQNFIKRIVKYVKVPVKFISVGPQRGQVIYV